MKSRILYIISALLFTGLFPACQQDELPGDGYGYMYVSVEEDVPVEVTPQMPGSKSASAEDMVFAVTVMQEGKVITEIPDYRTLLDNPLKLPTGHYTIEAVSGDESADAPFYVGTAESDILPHQVNSIRVVCSLANVKVTASFDTSVTDNFKEYSLAVSDKGGEGRTLSFSSLDNTVSGTGYLSAEGPLTWTLSLKNRKDEPYDITGVCEDVRPNRHYYFSFSLSEEKDEFGGGYFKIVLDGAMNEREEVGVIYPGAKAPEVVTEGFGFNESPDKPVEILAGDEASKILTFSHSSDEEPYGLRNIVISHDDAALAAAGLPYYIDLLGASSDEIALLNGAGILVPQAAEGAREVKADFGPFFGRLPLGEYRIVFKTVACMSTYTEKELYFEILSPYEVEAVSGEYWACFADLKAKWFAPVQPEGLSFQYRKETDSEWTDFDGEVVADAASKTYTGRIAGLEPETDYVWRAIAAADRPNIGSVEFPEINFKTETAEQLHNMSFDQWYMDGKAPMPNADPEHYIWDSANPGSAGMGYVPTRQETSIVAVGGDGKSAARLETLGGVPIVKLAAGNIYTGKFGDLAGLTGAYLDWGVQFSSRPIAMQGFYMYKPKTVDVGNHADMSGKTDICQIQIMLTDWDKPFTVNTKEETFVDVDTDPGIIAYGSLERNEIMSEYEPFTINLKYRDTTRIPKYIVIVCASSKYGDYFTGGAGSVLYLDEFELVYDPEKLEN